MADSTDSARVSVTVVGMTDVGRVRDHNEDNFLVLDRGSGRRLANGEQVTVDLGSALVMAVCDGMGGAAAGEIASQMAVDRAIKDLGGADYSSATPDQVMVLLEAAVQNANSDILKEAENNTERKGMGTTMTAGVAVPGQICIAQVGDSRGYLLRSGQLVQLTKDQSLIGQLIEEGTLTEEEAEALGGRNIVLQAVGVEEQLKVDTRPFDIRRGDLILMCSDGLNGMIKDKQMEEIVNASIDDLPTAAKNLIQAANDNGGKDNITVTLARFEGEGLKPPLATFSADDVDRGEGVFKTPDAVDVPNPMKKVGLVIGLIIAAIIAMFFLARRTTVDLPLVVSPSGVDVRIVLTDEKGNTVREMTVSDGSEVIEDLDTGKYVLTANADRHFERTIELELPNPGTAKTQRVALTPKRATVTIVSATAHVHVSVREGDATKPLTELDLERAGAEQKESVPGGKSVHVTASRAGFQDQTITLETEPEGTHEVRFDPLVAIEAQLPIRVDEDGVEVKIFDEYGEQIDKWTSPKRDAGTDLRVRPGKSRVSAKKSGFREFEKEVVVKAGQNDPVVIAMTQSEVPVVFTATRTLKAKLLIEDPATGNVRDTGNRVLCVPDGAVFRSRAERLAPGKYRADYKAEDGSNVSVTFVVPVGAEGKTVELNR